MQLYVHRLCTVATCLGFLALTAQVVKAGMFEDSYISRVSSFLEINPSSSYDPEELVRHISNGIIFVLNAKPDSLGPGWNQDNPFLKRFELSSPDSEGKPSGRHIYLVVPFATKSLKPLVVKGEDGTVVPNLDVAILKRKVTTDPGLRTFQLVAVARPVLIQQERWSYKPFRTAWPLRQLETRVRENVPLAIEKAIIKYHIDYQVLAEAYRERSLYGKTLNEFYDRMTNQSPSNINVGERLPPKPRAGIGILADAIHDESLSRFHEHAPSGYSRQEKIKYAANAIKYLLSTDPELRKNFRNYARSFQAGVIGMQNVPNRFVVAPIVSDNLGPEIISPSSSSAKAPILNHDLVMLTFASKDNGRVRFLNPEAIIRPIYINGKLKLSYVADLKDLQKEAFESADTIWKEEKKKRFGEFDYIAPNPKWPAPVRPLKGQTLKQFYRQDLGVGGVSKQADALSSDALPPTASREMQEDIIQEANAGLVRSPGIERTQNSPGQTNLHGLSDDPGADDAAWNQALDELWLDSTDISPHLQPKEASHPPSSRPPSSKAVRAGPSRKAKSASRYGFAHQRQPISIESGAAEDSVSMVHPSPSPGNTLVFHPWGQEGFHSPASPPSGNSGDSFDRFSFLPPQSPDSTDWYALATGYQQLDHQPISVESLDHSNGLAPSQDDPGSPAKDDEWWADWQDQNPIETDWYAVATGEEGADKLTSPLKNANDLASKDVPSGSNTQSNQPWRAAQSKVQSLKGFM